MVEYTQLELGVWFVMPKGYDWYKERHFLTLVPDPKTFEEFEDRLQQHYNFPEDLFFKVFYYNYFNFAVVTKEN